VVATRHAVGRPPRRTSVPRAATRPRRARRARAGVAARAYGDGPDGRRDAARFGMSRQTGREASHPRCIAFVIRGWRSDTTCGLPFLFLFPLYVSTYSPGKCMAAGAYLALEEGPESRATFGAATSNAAEPALPRHDAMFSSRPANVTHIASLDDPGRDDGADRMVSGWAGRGHRTRRESCTLPPPARQKPAAACDTSPARADLGLLHAHFFAALRACPRADPRRVRPPSSPT